MHFARALPASACLGVLPLLSHEGPASEELSLDEAPSALEILGVSAQEGHLHRYGQSGTHLVYQRTV